MGGGCGLGVSEGEEGESGLLLLDRLRSLWELVETGGLVKESMEETEEGLPCFPVLIFDELEVPRMSAEPFPFDIPFCFVGCTKPLCFLEVFPSFLVSDADRAWMHGVAGLDEAVWCVVGEQGFCPAGTGWPLTLGSFSFFTLSDEPFEFTSVLSASLIETCLVDLAGWLVMAGTEAAVEAVVKVDNNDSGCDDEDEDDDDNDDASVGEAADADCLDVVWTASKPER